MAAETDLGSVQEQVDELLREKPPSSTEPGEFLAAQFDAGLAWADFPPGEGGLGGTRSLRRDVQQALTQAGAPDATRRNPHGYHMGSAILRAFGTDAQRQRYLKPMFTAQERWCQLFSEPGAGSDLAGLACRAERDGDSWLVNGQKVWSSGALNADIGMLVTRSDPSVPKHRGLTYFLLDMHAPGVDIRPLRQLTGDAEFCEVFLDGVRVPDDARLGEEGDGWRVTIGTLMAERYMLGSGTAEARPIDFALELYRERAAGDPVIRDRLAELWIRGRALQLLAVRLASRPASQQGPEGSMVKAGLSALNQETYDLCMDMLGSDAMLYDTYVVDVAPPGQGADRAEGNRTDVRRRFLRSRANSIEGGTSEIMLNILGERVLGLPPDVRLDKDRPWSAIPRS
jgi:alkylation response protein AidB-like acyl-CoA dehydrogenase